MLRTHTVALPLLLAAVTAIATTLTTSEAHAAQRTHVSAAFGADTNTATGCSPVAPCRTFQSAMTVTDDNGEVIVLDSGGYGAVTITKSVALIAPTGVFAGISVFPGADGATIATPGINVALRGLSINGQGGNNGINMTAGTKLTVENCVISNLTQSGIVVNSAASVRVIDTIIRDNGNHGIHLLNAANGTITRVISSGNGVNNPQGASGIRVEGRLAGTTIADIADSTLDGNAEGVNAFSRIAGANVSVSVRDSRLVGNIAGMTASSGGPGTSAVNLSASNNILSNNNVGIQAGFTGTKVWATGNTASDNSVAGFQNIIGAGLGNAIFESAGDNAVQNNGTDIAGTVDIIVRR